MFSGFGRLFRIANSHFRSDPPTRVFAAVLQGTPIESLFSLRFCSVGTQKSVCTTCSIVFFRFGRYAGNKIRFFNSRFRCSFTGDPYRSALLLAAWVLLWRLAAAWLPLEAPLPPPRPLPPPSSPHSRKSHLDFSLITSLSIPLSNFNFSTF